MKYREIDIEQSVTESIITDCRVIRRHRPLSAVYKGL